MSLHSYLKFKIDDEEFEVHDNIDAENIIEFVRKNKGNFIYAVRIYESSYRAVTVQGDVIDLSEEPVHVKKLSYDELVGELEAYIV